MSGGRVRPLLPASRPARAGGVRRLGRIPPTGGRFPAPRAAGLPTGREGRRGSFVGPRCGRRATGLRPAARGGSAARGQLVGRATGIGRVFTGLSPVATGLSPVVPESNGAAARTGTGDRTKKSVHRFKRGSDARTMGCRRRPLRCGAGITPLRCGAGLWRP